MRTDTEATVELWQEQAMHNLQAAEDFKLELADARREICELEKQLTSERALADRLAEGLRKMVLYSEALILRIQDRSNISFKTLNECIDLFNQWKEARND